MPWVEELGLSTIDQAKPSPGPVSKPGLRRGILTGMQDGVAEALVDEELDDDDKELKKEDELEEDELGEEELDEDEAIEVTVL